MFRHDGEPIGVLPSIEVRLHIPPVFGLLSNASELTSSWFVPYPNPDNLESIAQRMAGLNYVVRGGPTATTDADSAEQLLKPWQEMGAAYRTLHFYQTLSFQVGFRCARSRSPPDGK